MSTKNRRRLIVCAGLVAQLAGCKGAAREDGYEADRAEIGLGKIGNAVSLWLARNRVAPESLQELVDAQRLRPEDLVDPWGTPYQLSADGSGKVCSHGSDKAPGGGDDLCKAP